ncbi:hypothetical protein C7999DRAFT_36589 [Corynascus novoguineensis]|uniref:Uncharacterized protein n=1 Tax=Corynascus novoguineensis TaxID=1126955 RepID=A0AAN7CJ94_9PEZI|nr:hypothetical protein C7999DRAFT_36589 [Corynascus novoguineensis]
MSTRRFDDFGGDDLAYTTICTVLEVTLWSWEEDFRKWRETYLSRTLVTCHLEVDCPESQFPRKRRHHARKRKRSAQSEPRTLQPDSIHRQGTQFRATGAGQHGEPAVSQRDKSLEICNSSALEREAETVPHSSRGQQVTPGVDLAGDASVRTAPAPRNSPAAPVDSESGGGIGQADRFCHEQDVATAIAGTSSHDAQKHSAPSLDIQEPCPIDTLGAHPPACDAGAHSWDVPPTLELLAAAGRVGDPDYEEAVGANLEYGRDQHVGPVALGLSLDAVVGNAAPPLQTYPPVGNEIDQPTSEESLGEAVRTKGIGIAACPQVPAGGAKLPASGISYPMLSEIGDGPDGSTGSLQADWAASDPQGRSDFMQRLSPS